MNQSPEEIMIQREPCEDDGSSLIYRDRYNQFHKVFGTTYNPGVPRSYKVTRAIRTRIHNEITGEMRTIFIPLT